MGTMGASIFVSDGDDGASSNNPDGSNPIDPDNWCAGSKWTCYPYTSSKCSEIQLKNTDSGETCPWPIGGMGDRCTWIFLTGLFQDSDIYNKLKTANPDCGLKILYDGSYGVHLKSDCTCDNLNPISHTWIDKYDHDKHKTMISEVYKVDMSKKFFFADFPTGSPYVTSVGATKFTSTDGSTVASEIAASVKTGSIITTGGGFVAYASRSSYQAKALDSWNLKKGSMPPSSQ